MLIRTEERSSDDLSLTEYTVPCPPLPLLTVTYLQIIIIKLLHFTTTKSSYKIRAVDTTYIAYLGK